jgi:tetratricopeptide (TPR) repeat protein
MYLSENSPEAQAMRENVLNLVKSQEEHNIVLAIQLMKGGGFMPETTVLLWRYALENTDFKKEVLQFLKNYLPTEAYTHIKNSFEYMENLPLFAMRYFEKLVQHEGFSWDSLVEHILSYGFNITTQMVTVAKDYFLQLPHVNKLKLLRAMITYETQLDLQDLQITTLPEEIGELQELTYISLYNTNITELPESFYTLKNLDSINVADTPLYKNPAFLPTLKEKAPRVWAYLAHQNISTNKIEEIERAYTEILEAVPTYKDAFHTLISSINNHKKHKKIVQYALRYPDLCGDDSYYDKIIADAFYQEQQYEKATEIYEKIVKSNNYSEPYRDLCKGYIQIGKTKEAIKVAKEAIAYDNLDILNHISLTDAYIAHKDTQKAIQTATNALQEDKYHSQLLQRLGDIHTQLGKLDKAKSYYEAICKNRYNDEEHWIVKAKVYQMLGKPREAMTWYRKIVDMGYYHTQEARIQLAYLRIEKKQYPQAETLLFENVQRVTEGFVSESYFGLACLGAVQGDVPFALKYLEKAVQESASCKELAKTSRYLDAIRQEPRFVELMA